MGEQIDELRQLASLVVERLPGLHVYEAGGSAIGQWLASVPAEPDNPLWPGAAVQICFMEEGQEFARHVHHQETEVLVCVCGIVEVSVLGSRSAVKLDPGDPFRLAPGEAHSAHAITRAAVLGVTIPRDGGYPSGPDSIEPGQEGRRT